MTQKQSVHLGPNAKAQMNTPFLAQHGLNTYYLLYRKVCLKDLIDRFIDTNRIEQDRIDG